MTTFSNVNVGASPNDGTGDSLRQSFITINNNFSYINRVIWPDISQGQLTANVISSYISRFNLLQAATVQGALFGNTGSVFTGNVYNASNSFQGQLGKYGGNAAIVSTLSATGTATVANLTVNGTATIGTLNASSISFTSLNDTPVGNATPSTGAFTTLSSSGNTSVNGNLTVSNYAIIAVTNNLAVNAAAATTINLSPVTTKQRVAVSANANITYTYGDIVAGCDRVVVVKNPTGSPYTLTFPTSFNNKGSTTVTLAAGYSAMLHFIPFDTTSANVFVNIVNN